MATTIDDLIETKNSAAEACAAAAAAWDSKSLTDLESAAERCRGAAELAELYDAAEEDEDAVSMVDYAEKHPEHPAAGMVA